VAPARGVFVPGTSVTLREAWRRPLGIGLSGIAVDGTRAYTVFSDGESDFAVAFAVGDGREVWRTRLDASLPAAERGPGGTPLVDGGRMFTLASSCVLQALEADTGRVAWTLNVKERFGVELRQGCQSSPLLEAGQVVVQTGAREDHRLAAFDPKSGSVAWTAKGAEGTFYASPTVADLAGAHQVVVHAGVNRPEQRAVSGLYGVSLADRSVLWSTVLDEGLSFETPLVLPGDRIALLTWNDARLLQLRRKDAGLEIESLWRSPELISYVSPPVFHDGHLYGFGRDDLACVDAATGRTVWKEKTYGGSLILVDGHLVALGVTSGLLRIVEATPAGYREKARLEVTNRGARAETPPSFAGGRIFVRNDEEIVAVDLVRGRV
jgi:outer membrane protein assembly factor BamB